MKLNRKLWTAALAVAMTTPSAMAAQDTAGMHYTSAAEGFYASIRLRYVSSVKDGDGHKDGSADLENGSSRFGVRGTNDLGGGLEGFYQYEAGVDTANSGGLSTRLGHVGLRGDFGSVVAGAFWPDTYNFVYGSTDVANRHSGYMTGGFGQYRTSKSLQYTTPDLNGFQGAVLIKADSGSDGEGKLGATVDKGYAITTKVKRVGEVDVIQSGMTVTRTVTETEDVYKKNEKDDSDIDHWSVVAKYDIAGFSTGFSYSSYADAIGHKVFNADTGLLKPNGRKDRNSWAFKLGYSQDNWYVNSWYGEISDADGGVCDTRTVTTLVEGGSPMMTEVAVKCGDTEVFSLAGGISVDKVKVYAVYDTRERDAEIDGNLKRADDTRSTLGVQYTLGSNSWTWVEYAGRDFDTSKTENSDFSIGLGHSF